MPCLPFCFLIPSTNSWIVWVAERSTVFSCQLLTLSVCLVLSRWQNSFAENIWFLRLNTRICEHQTGKKNSNIYRMDEWWVGVTIKHGNAEGNLISPLQLSLNVVLLLENHSEPRKYPRRDVKRNWSYRSVRGAAAIIYRAWRSFLFLSQLNPGRS